MERLQSWSDRMNGAKYMLYTLIQNGCVNLCPGIPKKRGNAVYHKAVLDWLYADLANIQYYMSGEPFYFTNFVKDDKGRLLSCEVTLKRPSK